MKQEEIREGIARRVAEAHGHDWPSLLGNSIHKFFYYKMADEILEYEVSQGVVIYVGSPDCRDYEDDILEPLIK